LILCIVGGTSSYSSTGVYQPQTETKVGVVLYLISFIALAAIAIVTAAKLSNAPSQDKRLVYAVLVALPLILVRIIYSLLSVYAHNRHFSLITGSVAIKVVMAVLEEMAVVIMYLAIGWKTDVLTPAERGPIASRPWKGSLGGGGQGGNGRRTRQGPIHSLVGAGIAATQHKKEMSEPDTFTPAKPEPVTSKPRKENVVGGGDAPSGNGGGARNGNGGRRMQGPIHALVGAGIAAAQNRKQQKQEMRQ